MKTILTLMAFSLLALIKTASAKVPAEYMNISKRLDKVESHMDLESPSFEEAYHLQEVYGGEIENVFLHARMNQVELRLKRKNKKYRRPSSASHGIKYYQLKNRIRLIEQSLK